MKEIIGYAPPELLIQLADLFAPIKKQSYELMKIGEGDHVLDVGCGVGYDVCEMAKIVGSTGKSVGIDHDLEAIDLAIEFSHIDGVDNITRFKHGNVEKLPFIINRFDAVRSERVFQHLSLQQSYNTLAEMVAVTKPGGYVVVVDTDWASMSFNTNELVIERKYRDFLLSNIAASYSGRRLYQLYNAVGGMDSIVVAANTVMVTDYKLLIECSGLSMLKDKAIESGAVTASEMERLFMDLEAVDRTQGTYGTITVTTVAGRKI